MLRFLISPPQDTMKKGNISNNRIKLARAKAAMAQVDLSAALEVDYGISLPQNVLSQIETGRRLLKDFELDAIARVLDVSPTWLLRGEEK